MLSRLPWPLWSGDGRPPGREAFLAPGSQAGISPTTSETPWRAELPRSDVPQQRRLNRPAPRCDQRGLARVPESSEDLRSALNTTEHRPSPNSRHRGLHFLTQSRSNSPHSPEPPLEMHESQQLASRMAGTPLRDGSTGLSTAPGGLGPAPGASSDRSTRAPYPTPHVAVSSQAERPSRRDPKAQTPECPAAALLTKRAPRRFRERPCKARKPRISRDQRCWQDAGA
jgi:hypothetical protein